VLAARGRVGGWRHPAGRACFSRMTLHRISRSFVPALAALTVLGALVLASGCIVHTGPGYGRGYNRGYRNNNRGGVVVVNGGQRRPAPARGGVVVVR
jgi:hypothetical protein